MEEKMVSEKKHNEKQHKAKPLLRLFAHRILIMAFLAFAVTVGLFVLLQDVSAKKTAKDILELNITDIKDRIEDYSNTKLLSVAENVKFYLDYKDKNFGKEFRTALSKQYEASNNDISFLKFLASKFGVTDIVVVGKDGIISCSSEEDQVGFDMRSGDQSREFLKLLGRDTQLAQTYQPMSKDNTKWRKYAGMKLEDGGFVQVAYGEDKFHSELDLLVSSLTSNRRIGESGYTVAFDEKGYALSLAGYEGVGQNISSLGGSLERLDELTKAGMTETVISGQQCDIICKKAEGFYLLGILPRSESEESRRSNTLAAASLVALTVIAVLFVIFALVKGTILNNLKKITEGLKEIAGGDLDITLDVKGNIEFESLSKDINTTVKALRDYRNAEEKRIKEELDYAKTIQRSSLPSVFPPFPNHMEFDIYATMTPAKEVGGDFFDFDLINDHYLGFCVADVSGKGVPAALFMMRAKTLIRSLGQAGLAAEEILRRVNNDLCTNNDEGMFVTCWLGIMDIDTGIIKYANAGHNLPVICRKDGTCSFLKTKSNFVLAGMENVQYKQYEVTLEPGDRIFVYSDGVTESTNSEKELFGDERLISSLEKLKNESCEDLCHKLRQDIDEFVGQAPQFDDITMLSLLYKGSDNVLTVEADLKNYDQIMDFIDAKLEEMECPPKDILRINVACDEVIANITSYAYGDEKGTISVHVNPDATGQGVEIIFSDNGMPFNPLEKKDPDLDDPIEKRPIGGLGIYMVKNTMDKVEYEYYNNSNNLKLIKYFTR